MDTKNDQVLTWNDIIDFCSKTVQKNLSFPLAVKYTQYKSYISKSLTEKIGEEFKELKKFTPNNIQLQILSRLKQEEKEELCKVLAGSLDMDYGINVVTGYGITCSGMTAIYFNNRNNKVVRFVDNLTDLLPYAEVHDSATHDNLYGKKIDRQKAFLLDFSIHLLKYASMEERELVLQADKFTRQITLELARQQWGFLRYGLTKSYEKYLSALIDYQFYSKIIFRILFNHILDNDIENFVLVSSDNAHPTTKEYEIDYNIAVIIQKDFKKKDYQSLLCTGTMFSNSRKSLIEEINKQAEQQVSYWNQLG